MKNMIKLFVMAIILTASFFIGLLGVKVILSLSTLYGLEFITKFSFVQVYGIWMLISIIRFRYEPDEKNGEKDFAETSFEAFIKVAANLAMILFSWGLGYLAYYIIT